MILFALNHLIQSLPAPENYRPAVGRPSWRIVLKAVVGQAMQLAVNIYGPQVGAFIGIFVPLMRIRNQSKRRAIRTPGGGLHVDAKMRQLFGCSAFTRDNV